MNKTYFHIQFVTKSGIIKHLSIFAENDAKAIEIAKNKCESIINSIDRFESLGKQFPNSIFNSNGELINGELIN